MPKKMPTQKHSGKGSTGSGRQIVGLRSLVLAIFIGVWEGAVAAFDVPLWLLPSPSCLAVTLWAERGLLFSHAGITLVEILLGLIWGLAAGTLAGFILANFSSMRLLLMPVLVISQALPVFALAPILVLWFGFGLASKIVMATLIVFFPITVAVLDGLRSLPHRWLEMAHVMNAKPLRLLRFIVIPAILPRFATGLRAAAATTPIAAVVGEWVGSGAGLGYLMLQANARLRTDLMFAALVVLAAIGLLLYGGVDRLMNHLNKWNE